MERIIDKISEIEKYIEELESFLPSDLDTYLTDFRIRALCERYFEKIVEAVVDLSFLVVKKLKLNPPEDDEGVFKVLERGNIISDMSAAKLRSAKSMRNIIVHEYGQINDELVFEAVTEELAIDVREFIDAIKKIV